MKTFMTYSVVFIFMLSFTSCDKLDELTEFNFNTTINEQLVVVVPAGEDSMLNETIVINIVNDDTEDYLDLFLKYDVRAVFSGHLHRNILSKHESIELVTSGPVCKAKGENPEHSGIRIVKVFEEHIKHTYYPLDDVPAKIILNE